MITILKEQLKPILFTLSGAIFSGTISDIIVRVATFDGSLESITLLKFVPIYLILMIISLLVGWIAHKYPNEPIKYFSLRGRDKKQTIKIGIFNDIPWTRDDDENHSWNNIEPVEWLEKYTQNNRAERLSVQMINIHTNFYDFDVLINPYGGVYKDTDLDKRPVLNRILDYVKTGGIYVNVSDTPFYYTFREELGYRVESRVQGVYLGHQFPGQITPLTSELNFYCTQHILQEIEESFSPDYKCLEQIDKPSIEMLKFAPIDGTGIDSIYKPVNHEGNDYSSMFFVRYGNGQFLISLLPFYLSQKNDINSDYLERWMDLITKLSLSKLSTLKKLD